MAPGILLSEPAHNYSHSSPDFSSACSTPDTRTDAFRQEIVEPIAVVGLSLKFPQDATSPEAFWKMIMEKRCAMTEIPADRLETDSFYGTDKSRNDTISVRGGHFLEEAPALFDAPFFSITSAEAASMDVQQRALLETAYRALENAGMPLEKVNGSKTSVHTGSFADDYRLMTLKDQEGLPKHAATGASISILANRLSWFFNFSGPSVHLDSACSSSMMALDMACQGLRNGDSNMALVAGSNTIWALEPYLILANMNFLSPDSRCYSFDHRANGYARGEGFGVLILKRLADAIEDGDSIRAVIRSTGSNSDGRTPGITQPSRDAQERLIKETYEKAGLDLRATRFFEAHGTGTPVGDPIEAGAIGGAFGKYRSPDEPLYVGAVKSNVGHLEGASGVAGVIKTILALEKGIIPPNSNFEQLNPKIDAPSLNLRFPTQAMPWPTGGLRRASVNSFGFGGSNAHVVLDDAYNFLKNHGLRGFHHTVADPPSPEQLSRALGTSPPLALENGTRPEGGAELGFDELRPSLLVWSAADEGGLDRIAKSYSEHFKALSLPPGQDNQYMSDLAFTLAARRSALPWKSFAVTHSLSQLQNAGVSLSKAVRSSKKLGLAYIFTGQGAQFAGMGRELLVYPVYKRTLQRAELYLHDMGCSWSLMDELLKEKGLSNVNGPEFSQPLCTALQIALVELLRSFSITPTAVVGHSSGEIAAAYCTGALSLRAACKVAYSRGRLAAQLAKTAMVKGSMLAVGLPESKVGRYLSKVALRFKHAGLVVACINSPKNVTISGDEEQIDAVKDLLDEDSIFARKLQVEVAYHSPHMNQIAHEYLLDMGDLEMGETLRGCQLMVSSVTNRPANVKELCQADYWVKNMTSPVRFCEAVTQLASASAKSQKKKLGGASKDTVTIYDLLELGPHSALAGPTKDILKTVSRGEEVIYASSLTRNVSALDTTLSAAGRLHCLGYPVKVANVNLIEATKTTDRMTLTDLPEYPFDHSQAYWHESRISKDLRLRKHPRLDLLGTQSVDWNPLEARWRKFIRSSETPWVEDHVVNGSVIYPAAGMLVMAVEGARQLADASRVIKGIRIRDAAFQRALNVPSTNEGVESQLCMRPLQDAFDKDSLKYDFKICMLEDGAWGENCRGTIQVEYADDETEVDGGSEAVACLQRYKDLYEERVRGCERNVESKLIYDHFRNIGLEFGAAFRTLRNISCNNEGDAVGEVTAFKWTSQDGMNQPQPHLIHPTTLDGLIQLALVGLTKGAQDTIPATVPTRVTNLWLSASGLAFPETTSLQASSNHLSTGYRQTESSIFAVDKAGQLVASMSVLETTNVDQRDAGSDTQSAQRQLCYNMDWKPDISLLPTKQAQAYWEVGTAQKPEPVDFYQDLRFFLFSATAKTLPGLERTNVHEARRHYVDWMRLQVERYDSGQLAHAGPDWSAKLHDTAYQNALCQRIETSSSEGKFYVEVVRNLPQILQGEVDPLAVLFQGDLAKNYYLEINARLSSQFAKLIDLLCHKVPGLKVLEVGAGTGGTTAHIMAPLFTHGVGEQGTPRCSQYDFTDISPAFFEKAQEDFKDYASRMKYKVLDIERDVLQQGFETKSYDLVVAANVLHATKHLDVTLKHVHTLLKPGGKLVLLEQTGDFARGGFAFGLLPGWWLSADGYRTWGPTMTPQKWDNVLKLNGFAGTEYVLNDYRDSRCQELSVIVSSALEPSPPRPSFPKTIILATEDSLIQHEVALRLRDALYSKCSPTCEIATLEEAVALADLSERFCIVLPELESPFLSQLAQDSFTHLQSALTSVQGIIWVSKGGGVSAETPEYQVADGLLRTLRTENAMLKAVTLALDPSNISTESAAETIFKVLESTLSKDINEFEIEYLEMDGVLHINRVVEANYMNQFIQKVTRPQESLKQPFGAAGLPPLALNFQTPGLLDSLRFIEDSTAAKPLLYNEVEIEVRATGVNFMDCLTALGRINQTEIGGECAGVVTRVGSACDLVPGDRVCGIVFDCFKSFARSDAQTLMRIPDELSFIDAAALPMTYTTAHHALVETGRLLKGETILIHAAAGGTGQAAVQLAKNIGAEIFVTVGSESKRKLLLDLYGIPRDHIFYSRNTTFAQGVMRMTQNRGVDVVLNSLAGEGLSATWECIASFGRFVEIGKRDIHSHSRLDMFQFAKNVSFSAVDIFGMSRERPGLVRKSLSAVMALVAEKKVCASQPLNTYAVSQIEDAFRYMQSGKNVGKIVVDMKKDDQVLTVLNTKPSYYFEPRATYVLAGGFGGLARRTARWMASRGARNLILLSRSGPRTDAAALLLQELRAQNVYVEAPACDITSSEALSRILTALAEKMPPIKGCIQGAMVLKDAVFEKMTFDDWRTALAPKLDGSRNLHELLPSGLDFFIMLSSVVGIHGSAGQANYASGGTYQDSLACHRISKGEKATVVDLGWMASDGIIAESEFLSKAFETSGVMMPIDSTEYLALLDYYCNPSREVATPLASQIMVGLETPAALQAKGADVPALLQRPTFKHMHQMGIDETFTAIGSSEGTMNYAVAFTNAGSAAEAGEVVVEGLTHKLSKALSIPPGDIDTSKPLHSYGVDSLLAVELRSWFAKELKADVAIFEIMGGASFAAVAAAVASKSSFRQASWD